MLSAQGDWEVRPRNGIFGLSVRCLGEVDVGMGIEMKPACGCAISVRVVILPEDDLSSASKVYCQNRESRVMIACLSFIKSAILLCTPVSTFTI